MNSTTPTASRPWPAQVELRHAHDRHVVGAEGIRLDLDAFRDACRAQATELRQQAVAQAGGALRAAAVEALRALGRGMRHGGATAPHAGA